jgi:hypothetical protein
LHGGFCCDFLCDFLLWRIYERVNQPRMLINTHWAHLLLTRSFSICQKEKVPGKKSLVWTGIIAKSQFRSINVSLMILATALLYFNLKVAFVSHLPILSN